MTDDPDWRKACRIISSLCIRFVWLRITPLGEEVEPEVYRRRTSSLWILRLCHLSPVSGAIVSVAMTSILFPLNACFTHGSIKRRVADVARMNCGFASTAIAQQSWQAAAAARRICRDCNYSCIQTAEEGIDKIQGWRIKQQGALAKSSLLFQSSSQEKYRTVLQGSFSCGWKSATIMLLDRSCLPISRDFVVPRQFFAGIIAGRGTDTFNHGSHCPPFTRFPKYTQKVSGCRLS